MSNARQRVSIHNDDGKRYKTTIFFNVVRTGNYLRILFLPFRSFLQLVGDLDELKKKDYPELTDKTGRLILKTEVSKGNTWLPFCIKTLQCHQKNFTMYSFYFD